MSYTFRLAVQNAMELAYAENADQIVGLIDDRWYIAHVEDVGRQYDMSQKYLVHSDGIDRRHAAELSSDADLLQD